MARKTLDVEKCKHSTNRTLTILDTPEGVYARHAIIALFTEFLMMHDAYKGFRYLKQHQVEPGQLPGIRTDEHGEPHPDYEERFRNTDETRIAFL